MRTELVETLLKAGVVKESQIQRALEYHFSTGLVERLLSLGYGSEDDVYKIIKNNLKLAVIEGNELDNISPEVLSAVPSDMITRNHFLPFYADETKIHIAFFDPTKDSCFNEIQFFTSKKIVPFGVRASVLAKALNKYFSLNVPEEFKFGKEQIVNPELTPPPLVESEPVVEKQTLPPIPSTKEAPAAPKPPLPTIEKSKYVDASFIEAANDKEQIINAVNDELKKISNKFLLLFVKYDELVTVDRPDIKIPLQVPSFFKDVYDSAKRFYGIPPKSYLADEFFNKLGGYLPQIICVVPVSIENEVFAIIYAEGVDNPMQAEEVADAMAKAFDRLLS